MVPTKFQLLKNYYQNKSRAFTEAMAKTQNEFWNKQANSIMRLTAKGRSMKQIQTAG